MYAFKLKNLSSEATKESISQRLESIFECKEVEVRVTSDDSGGKEAVGQMLCNIALPTVKKRLRAAKFHQYRVGVEVNQLTTSNGGSSTKQGKKTKEQSSGKSSTKQDKRSKQLSSGESSTKVGKESKKQSTVWTYAKVVAPSFHRFVNSSKSRLKRSSDRDQLSQIFQEFLVGRQGTKHHFNERRLLESILQHLQQTKMLRTKRLKQGKKLIIFSTSAGDFPSKSVMQGKRKRVVQKMAEDSANKEGVVVVNPQLDSLIVKVGEPVKLCFQVQSNDELVSITDLHIQGDRSNAFNLAKSDFSSRALNTDYSCPVTFHPKNVGIFQCTLRMTFQNAARKTHFQIARFVRVKSGDPEMDDILKPVAPYKPKKKKKKRNGDKPSLKREIVDAPKSSSSGSSPLAKIPQYSIPKEVVTTITDKKFPALLENRNECLDDYQIFWRHLLWASEFQARQDIKLFDITRAKLCREGKFLLLKVPGLAEGRPSVLRGDMVSISWKSKIYKGRVLKTRELDAILEFHKSFHDGFDPVLDTADVRFGFSRTVFRTSHHGLQKALLSLGDTLLFPSTEHRSYVLSLQRDRSVPHVKWHNRDLNQEQQSAVTSVLQGACRPLPNLLFGPPGTGKTTTIVEMIYQLAHHPDKPKILIAAPSNDASDIFIEKLSALFPPSEMRRILAHSRSLDQHTPIVRKYARDGLSSQDVVKEAMGVQIVVCTVNFAARLGIFGVPRGHFGVVCVDEAGHATEPEVVAVMATLLDFERNDSKVGQLILAGDPQQLGPVVTSNICREYGLATSYMERLTLREVYGRNENDEYPADLITKLIRNYRSHPAILKLPNEMFYHGELVPCGDKMKTHDMTRWEYLLNPNFPVLFHAVYGENLRESNSPSWFNPQEAQVVLLYVERLVKESRPPVQPQDIGVITPYARQAQKIRLALKSRNLGDIKVGSVETFQGQERRCIILSTVRAESELIASDLKYNLGFVANEKRFNVAITRPTSLLLVIGHPKVLATDQDNWLPLLLYCKENKSWVGEPWDEETHPSDFNDAEVPNELVGDESEALSAKMAQEAIGFMAGEE